MLADLVLIARLADPALAGASSMVLLSYALTPWLLNRYRPWGVCATVLWLSSLHYLLLASADGHPFWRGFTLLAAAADAWFGWMFYRRWRDDNDQRPRRRRRVWRLAKAGA